jgi:anti-anti-sigma factor
MRKKKRFTVEIKYPLHVMEVNEDLFSATDDQVLQNYERLHADGAKKILIKFHEGVKISSAGIALLVRMITEAQGRGQTLGVCGLSRHTRQVLEIAGLSEFLTVYNSEEEARTAM